MKQINDVQLRPCPLCGGKAVMGSGFVESYLGELWRTAIWCVSCDAFVTRRATAKDLLVCANSEIIKKIVQDKAIEAWNIDI